MVKKMWIIGIVALLSLVLVACVRNNRMDEDAAKEPEHIDDEQVTVIEQAQNEMKETTDELYSKVAKIVLEVISSSRSSEEDNSRTYSIVPGNIITTKIDGLDVEIDTVNKTIKTIDNDRTYCTWDDEDNVYMNDEMRKHLSGRFIQDETFNVVMYFESNEDKTEGILKEANDVVAVYQLHDDILEFVVYDNHYASDSEIAALIIMYLNE